jgi:hypothetical protein
MAPSCSGFQPADAGSPRGFPGCNGEDAGPGTDAGTGGDGGSPGGTDSGTPQDSGAALDGGGGGGSDAGPGASDGGGSRDAGATADASARDGGEESQEPDTDDGCDCSVRAGHRKLPDLAGFGLALWLLTRRLRAPKRRTDA